MSSTRDRADGVLRVREVARAHDAAVDPELLLAGVDEPVGLALPRLVLPAERVPEELHGLLGVVGEELEVDDARHGAPSCLRRYGSLNLPAPASPVKPSARPSQTGHGASAAGARRRGAGGGAAASRAGAARGRAAPRGGERPAGEEAAAGRRSRSGRPSRRTPRWSGPAAWPSRAPAPTRAPSRTATRDRRVRHAPAAAAHADRPLAGHPPGEHHAARARRPHRLAGRGREVDAAVLPAREGIGPEAEEPRRLAGDRRRPARGGARRGGEDAERRRGGRWRGTSAPSYVRRRARTHARGQSSRCSCAFRHSSVQIVGGSARELGDDRGRRAGAGARLDEPADGVDRARGSAPSRGGAAPMTSTTSPRGGASA